MVEGPVGRSFAAALAGIDPGYLVLERKAGIPAHVLAEQIGEASSIWIDRGADVSDVQLRDTLGIHVDDVAFGSGRFWRQIDDVLVLAASFLEPIEESIRGRASTLWWQYNADLHGQVALDLTYARSFDPAVSLDESASLADGDATWWLTPTRLPVTISDRAVIEGRLWLRDDFAHEPLVSVASINYDSARVFEVHSPEDWVRLVELYPRGSSRLLTYDWAVGDPESLVVPEWPSIARDWDAVHVSVGGYLSSAYTTLPLADGRWTVLAGWHPDATVWLNARCLA